VSFARLFQTMIVLFGIALPGCRTEAMETIRFMNVRTEQPTTMDRVLPELAKADIVLLGEFHDQIRSHEVQLAIIQAMHESGVPVVVGLEMFQHKEQKALDRWVLGEASEEEFRADFERNWGFGWGLYRDIFLYCREKSIPMVGLNVPREITSQVAARGFESLSPEQLGQLPPISCTVDPKYRELLKGVLGAHGNVHGQNTGFENFCEAQVLWDTAMAYFAVQYLKSRPKRTMLLLCGAVHAWKPAIPAQVERMDRSRTQVVFMPRKPGSIAQETMTVEDADYLYE
jgi:uncharacterized iron-regulated protein